MTEADDRDHPEAVERLAAEIYGAYDPEKRGKAPSVTRATCLYAAYRLLGHEDPPTQTEIASEFDCTSAAIRKRLHAMNEELALDEWDVNTGPGDQ